MPTRQRQRDTDFPLLDRLEAERMVRKYIKAYRPGMSYGAIMAKVLADMSWTPGRQPSPSTLYLWRRIAEKARGEKRNVRQALMNASFRPEKNKRAVRPLEAVFIKNQQERYRMAGLRRGRPLPPRAVARKIQKELGEIFRPPPRDIKTILGVMKRPLTMKERQRGWKELSRRIKEKYSGQDLRTLFARMPTDIFFDLMQHLPRTGTHRSS